MSRVPVDREDEVGGRGVDRRVHVVERPLVGGQGAVRVLEPFAAHQQQLVLREGRVDVGERDRVEGEVPRREPRVLPWIGHRQDVGRLEVPPGRVAAVLPLRWRRWQARVAVEPARDVVAVVLLAPQHPGERLAHDPLLVVGPAFATEGLVELIGLGLAPLHRRLERRPERIDGRDVLRRGLAVAALAVLGGRRIGSVWLRLVRGARLGHLGSLRRRSRSSAVSPGRTSSRYHGEAFVPTPSGLTVGAPPMTWSLIPSFGYGVIDGARRRSAARFVSFSQKSSVGWRPVRTGADVERVIAQLGVARQDRPAVRARAAARAWPARGSRTTRCGTTASAGRGAWRSPGPGCAP